MEDPLKIRIIGTAWPFRGGLAAYNERLAREFIRMGHQAELETFTLQYPAAFFPGKSQMATWEKPRDLVISRSVNSINPFNWIRTGIRIRNFRDDLVIFKYWIPFMSPCFSTLARIIRSNRKTRVICIADNIIPHERRACDRFLTRIFMNSIDGIVAMSRSVSDDITLFRKDIPRRLSPHPMFDDFGEPVSREEALEKLGLDPSFRYLLFFGFIRDYKGLDWLLNAFADKRFRRLPLRLIVAGEFYSDSRIYMDMISRLNLTDSVILRNDFIPNSEVNNYFCASDLVVQPYKHATQSGVTQIGYYFNKPMLVTNVGGLSEIIPHNRVGYVVEPDPSCIADAIADFFSRDRKVEFENNIGEEKKKYLWSNMVNAILEVFKEIPES
jgi:glycosyltransferase involved in cell wall biosynthesis